MKNVMKISLLSLSAAVVLGVSGCSSSDGDSKNPPPATDKLITGKAVDGYLAGSQVCYDLDHNLVCDTDEPNATTGANGDFNLTVTPAQAASAHEFASLLVSGGTDIDTGEAYVGMLQAPYDGTESINLTPLTTMASAIVANGGSIDEAYENVAGALGIPLDAVDDDPVAAAAGGDSSLMAATMSVQRIVEVMAAATIRDNNDTMSDENTTQVMNDIYASLGDAIEEVANDGSKTGMADIVQAAAEDENTTLPEAAQTAADSADLIEEQVDDALVDGYEPDDALAVDAGVEVVQDAVNDAVENNTTVDASATQASADAAAAQAAQEAKVARIQGLVDSVAVLNLNLTSALADANSTLVTIDGNVSSISTILSEEYNVSSIYNDANATRTEAHTAYNTAVAEAQNIVGANATVNQAKTDVNETVATNAEAAAQTARTAFDTAIASIATKATTVETLLTDATVVKESANAAATALAILTAQNSAQGYLNTVTLNVEAAQANATAARTAASSAQAVADANQYAQSYATASANAATAAETAASTAAGYLVEAQTHKANADAATTIAVAEAQAGLVQTKIALAATEATNAETQKNLAEAKLLLAQGASTTAPVMSEKVATLIDAADTNASVADAKNMFAQLRETVNTFVDVNSDELNTSTIIGSEFDAIDTKVTPVVDAMVLDFEATATALENSLDAFNVSIEDDFNATVTSISDRVSALLDQIDAYSDDQNWSVSATNSDTLSKTVTVSGTTKTEIITFNGTPMTIISELNGCCDETLISANGTFALSGTDYNLSVSSFALTNGVATLHVTGSITGENGSAITLTGLDVTIDIDMSVDNVNMFQNPSIAFNSIISAGGRSFEGIINVGAQDSLMSGKYTGSGTEPSFEGNVTAVTAFNDFVDTAANNRESDVDKDHPLLMIENSSGVQSFVASYNQSGNWDNLHYEFTTQSLGVVSCDMILSQNSGPDGWRETNTVQCDNNETIHAYYTHEKKIIVTTSDDVEMVVHDAWTDWNGTENEVRIYFDDDEAYMDNAQLTLNGDALTIKSIRMEDNIHILSGTYDLKFEGKIEHGDKRATVVFGVNRDIESELFAQNILLTDGTNFVKMDTLSLIMPNVDFMKNFEHSEHDSDNYSRFENYTYEYSYDECCNDNENDFEPENILELTLNGLSLSITDNTGEVLTVDANISHTNRTSMISEFNGRYAYGTTQFVGHADTDVTVTELANGEDEVLGTVNVLGTIEANGFVPFGIDSTTQLSANHGMDIFALFTRDNSYELGIHTVSVENANGSNSLTTTIGDSNGVLGSMIYAEDTQGNDTNTGLIVTNKNGDELATYGESQNNNEWEILYSDTTSETLF